MTEAKGVQDPLQDEAIPTYEEFREAFAKEVRETPQAILFKGVVEFVRYLFTREALIISLLVEKGVISAEEVDARFGAQAHQETQAAGIKSLKKYLLNAAATGKIVSEAGKQVNPDDILVIMDDLLDLNDKGWNGKAVETVSEFVGRGEMLREAYDKQVADVKALNALRAARRSQIERLAQSKAQTIEDRLRRLRIYQSQCNIADKPLPTEGDVQKMLDGLLPIPETP